MSGSMKAIVLKKYGKPTDSGVLYHEDVEVPAPGEKQVLLKVHASSINSGDWHILRGSPKILRLAFGLVRPKIKILGNDVAGEVVALGKDVTSFKVGDEVFGELESSGFGGYAEYARCREDNIIKKPTNLSFEQSAAVPCAALTALQAVRDVGRVEIGHKVLVNGASGGVGSFAVQIAKHFGAKVTATCSTNKIDMVKSLGPDNIIDYKKENYTKQKKKYDVIIDAAAYSSISANANALVKGGTYVIIGGSFNNLLKSMLLGGFIKLAHGKNIKSFLVEHKKQDMMFLKKLLEEEKLFVSVHKVYSLNEVPQAFQDLEDRKVQGKLVITVKS